MDPARNSAREILDRWTATSRSKAIA